MKEKLKELTILLFCGVTVTVSVLRIIYTLIQ